MSWYDIYDTISLPNSKKFNIFCKTSDYLLNLVIVYTYADIWERVRQISPRHIVYTKECSKIMLYLVLKVDYLNYIKSLRVVIHLEESEVKPNQGNFYFEWTSI